LKVCIKVFLLVAPLTLSIIGMSGSFVHGFFAKPHLMLNPSMYVARHVGETFDINVSVYWVENLRSIEFVVGFNTSLLDVEQVDQGLFFPPAPKSHLEFLQNETAGLLRINLTLAISEDSKDGSGQIARITFKVTLGPTSCTNSPLDIQQSVLLDSTFSPISHDIVGAVYFWKSMQPDPPEEGRLLDVYTHKGGQGADQPSGGFVLGETVDLTSRVTYNGDSVQYKLVAFQVISPSNETVLIRTVFTDGVGLATVSFRIPSLIRSIGNWSVISIVDIREKAVWDTLVFSVKYAQAVGGYTAYTETQTYAELVVMCLPPIVLVCLALTEIKHVRKKHAKDSACTRGKIVVFDKTSDTCKGDK
jgi:hypothetical protein